MSTSPSTPRIRLTQALYALAVLAVALGGGRLLQGPAGMLLQAVGFALVVAAVLGRLWASAFIAGRKDEQLVREGPYAACRHPLYLYSVVAALGLGLSSRSLLLAALLPVAVAVIVLRAARQEERLMEQRHGAAWRDYRGAVPAFWPRRGRPPLPAATVMSPAIYRKAFLDAASFLGLWLLVVLADALRESGAWPALFRLP